MPNEFNRPIARPEWLHDSIKSTRNTLFMAAEGLLPEAIKGWMLHVACVRVLRSIHGSDTETMAAIQRHMDAEREAQEQMAAHEIANPAGCRNQNCMLCHDGDEPPEEMLSGASGRPARAAGESLRL